MTATNITPTGTNTFKAFVQDYRACNNINKRLRQYKDGKALYTFTEGEEAVFFFTINDLRFVDATLATFGCAET